MNPRWESYIKNNTLIGRAQYKEFVDEYGIDLDKAIDVANIEDQMLLSLALQEIKKLHKEVKSLKRKTKKVVEDE